jgi:hypothetical protein
MSQEKEGERDFDTKFVFLMYCCVFNVEDDDMGNGC